MPSRHKWVTLGKVIREWGIHGQVKCLSYNPNSTLFSQLKKIFLKEEQDWRPFEIENARPQGRYWVLKLSGYENPEDAKALRGAALALPRDELPPPGRGEIYLADLEGLKVLSPDGSELGSIQCFQQVGDSEVMMVGGNVTDAVGVPFEPEFIQSASTEAGEVIVTEYALELFA